MNKILLYGIATSHQLARELLDRPDEFISAIVGNKEYGIESIKRITTHANRDDGVIHLALKLKECEGNIIR